MEELIDILDENGKKTGRILSKEKAHKQKLRHNAAHIRVYNSKGEILFQKRSLQKGHHPGLRDIAAGGHIIAGEAIIEGAIRELEEEIHIKANPDDLHPMGKRKHNGENHKYFNNLFIYKYDGKIEDLVMQSDEVDDLRFISVEQFKADVENPEIRKQYVERNMEYLGIILQIVDKSLSK